MSTNFDAYHFLSFKTDAVMVNCSFLSFEKVDYFIYLFSHKNESQHLHTFMPVDNHFFSMA